MKTNLKKLHFVEANPQPCSLEEAEKHLRAFAETFIDKKYVDRWIHILLEKPEKAKNELVRFEKHLDARYCKDNGTDAFPVSLTEKYGARLGVYFDGYESPCRMTVSQAARLSTKNACDALFSIVPGQLALFFFHEGDA